MFKIVQWQNTNASVVANPPSSWARAINSPSYIILMFKVFKEKAVVLNVQEARLIGNSKLSSILGV